MFWREGLRKSFVFLAVGMFGSLSILLPMIAPGTAHAAGPAVRVLHETISAKMPDNNTLQVSFTAQPCIDAFFSNDCISPLFLGSLTANYEKNATSVTLKTQILGPRGDRYNISKARVFKVNKSSFEPRDIEVIGYGKTAKDESWKSWDSLRILVANSSDVKPSIKEGPLISFFMEVNGSGYSSIKGKPQNDSNLAISPSVQEALASGYNHNSPQFIVPLSEDDIPIEGNVDNEEVSALMSKFDMSGPIIIKDNDLGKESPPVIEFLSKDVNSELEKLTFTFNKVFLTGSATRTDNYFFWFKANDFDNLWILIDSDGDAVLTITNLPEDQVPSNVIKGSLRAGGNFTTDDQERSDNKGTLAKFILNRIVNRCDTANECQAGNYTKIVDYPNGNGDVSVGNILNYSVAFPGNGINEKPWLGVWGVSYEDRLNDGQGFGERGCSLNWIVDGGVLARLAGAGKNEPPSILENLEIDDKQLNPFTRLSLCIYIWTIVPFSEWVATLIVNVGGIAEYIRPKDPNYINA